MTAPSNVICSELQQVLPCTIEGSRQLSVHYENTIKDIEYMNGPSAVVLTNTYIVMKFSTTMCLLS